MELRKATALDLRKVKVALNRKHIPYCTAEQIEADFNRGGLYVVADGLKVLAITSVVDEPNHGYIALKRGCVLNKKNCRRGLMHFSLKELSSMLHGTIGATPWVDNVGARHLLESEGFTLRYIFNEKWCFYAKEV